MSNYVFDNYVFDNFVFENYVLPSMYLTFEALPGIIIYTQNSFFAWEPKTVLHLPIIIIF